MRTTNGWKSKNNQNSSKSIEKNIEADQKKPVRRFKDFEVWFDDSKLKPLKEPKLGQMV